MKETLKNLGKLAALPALLALGSGCKDSGEADTALLSCRGKLISLIVNEDSPNQTVDVTVALAMTEENGDSIRVESRSERNVAGGFNVADISVEAVEPIADHCEMIVAKPFLNDDGSPADGPLNIFVGMIYNLNSTTECSARVNEDGERATGGNFCNPL